MIFAALAGGVGAVTAAAGSAVGIYVYPMDGASFGVHAAVRLLTFYGSQYSLEIGLAHNAIDGGVETPSSMCQATANCVAAVNGDYFDVTNPRRPDPGDEVGGIIRNCVLLHTPEISHQQADLDGESVSNNLNWSSALDVNGVKVPITAVNQELPMSYVGVNVPLRGTLLFTSPYALKTPSARGRVTYEFASVDASANPMTINTTVELELKGRTTQALRVRAGRLDVSAPKESALSSLEVGGTVSIATDSAAGCDNIGGHPIILDNGVPGTVSPTDSYMNAPSARTAIGWTAQGETVIMTVGGADGESGATWSQLVAMLQSLDVTTALDLDGGTSTALFANGRLLYPSSRSERQVSTSVLIVQSQ